MGAAWSWGKRGVQGGLSGQKPMQCSKKQQEPNKCWLWGQLNREGEESVGVMEFQLEDPRVRFAF